MKLLKITTIYPLILLIITSILTLIHANNPQVTFTDEVLFEEASFRMARGDGFLIPQLGNHTWLEKPPLYFWLTAPIYHLTNYATHIDLFNLNQSLDCYNRFIFPFIRRFWTIAAAHITILYTYLIAKRLYSPLHGLLAGLLLISTPLFLFTTLAASLDLSATAFISASIYYYIKNKTTLKSAILVGSLIGAAVMTRSLLAFTPLVVIYLHQLLTHKFTNLKFLIQITVITFIIILPWHIYAYIHHPKEILNTYLGFNVIDHGLKVPPGYATSTPIKYFRVLLIQNPWFLTLAIWSTWQTIKYLKQTNFSQVLNPTFVHKILITNSQLLPITLWLLIPLLVLSAAATRHEWYLIQLLPPIAILASPLILKARQYTLHPQRLILKHLTEIFFISFLITTPFVIFTYRNNSAPVIVALLETADLTPPNHPIYVYDQPYLPQTLLFSPMQVRIITNTDQLNQGLSQTSLFYIFIADQNLDELQTQYPTLQLIKEYQPGGIYTLSSD